MSHMCLRPSDRVSRRWWLAVAIVISFLSTKSMNASVSKKDSPHIEIARFRNFAVASATKRDTRFPQTFTAVQYSTCLQACDPSGTLCVVPLKGKADWTPPLQVGAQVFAADTAATAAAGPAIKRNSLPHMSRDMRLRCPFSFPQRESVASWNRRETDAKPKLKLWVESLNLGHKNPGLQHLRSAVQ